MVRAGKNQWTDYINDLPEQAEFNEEKEDGYVVYRPFALYNPSKPQYAFSIFRNRIFAFLWKLLFGSYHVIKLNM